MISLDQVQLLEKKVATIVAKMNELQKQNAYLLAQNKEFARKNEELYAQNQVMLQKVSAFEADQSRIEQGILNALEKLNAMENDGTNSSPLHLQNETVAEETAIETSSASESVTTTESTPSNQAFAQNSIEPSITSEEKAEPEVKPEPEKMSTDLNLDDDVFDFLNFEETSESTDKNTLDLF